MSRFILALFFTFSASAALAQSCPEIKFARGASSGSVSGLVSDGRPLCFTFGSGSGQTARIQLSGSRNTCFNVDGLIDCQDDFSFRTRRATYVIRVHQLFRNGGSEQFALRLSIR